MGDITDKVITKKLIISVYAIPGLVQRKVTMDDIDMAVCRISGIMKADLLRPTRQREIVEARQLAMYFGKKYTMLSFPEIGARYNKDHSTVIHACKTVNNLLDTNLKFRENVRKIDQQIRL